MSVTDLTPEPEDGSGPDSGGGTRKGRGKGGRSMPVVQPLDGPPTVRTVDAPLVSPVPQGGFRGVLRQHYLLKLLVKREMAARYAASLLGLLWSYIQPGLRFFVYYFVFGYVMTWRGNSNPLFALRLFTGIVVVQLFAQAWGNGTRSIWANRRLVLKMRVPREIFPIASILTAIYHTAPQVLLVTVAAILYGWSFDAVAIGAGLLGFAILLTFATAMALIFSVLNVYARDFQNVVGTVTQFMHFLVPMMYPFYLIYERGQNHPVIYEFYMANPIATVVLLLQRCFWYPALDEAQQSAIGTAFPPDLFERGAIMLVVSVLLLWVAQRVFRRLSGDVAERL